MKTNSIPLHKCARRFRVHTAVSSRWFLSSLDLHPGSRTAKPLDSESGKLCIDDASSCKYISVSKVAQKLFLQAPCYLLGWLLLLLLEFAFFFFFFFCRVWDTISLLLKYQCTFCFEVMKQKSTDVELVQKHLRMCRAHDAVVPFQVGTQ